MQPPDGLPNSQSVRTSSTAPTSSSGVSTPTPPSAALLCEALLHLSLGLKAPIEPAAGRRLIEEVLRVVDNGGADVWCRALTEAARSEKLCVRALDVLPRDLAGMVFSGLSVILLDPETGRLSRAELAGRRVEIVELGGSGRRTWHAGPRTKRDGQHLLRVVIGDNRLQEHESHHHDHIPPLRQLWRLIRPEQKDIWAVVAMAGVAGLLMLAVPVTAQQLVRSVTFGGLYQPILILTLVLLSVLAFVAALVALQTYVAEIVQRRLFARVVAVISHHLPRVPLGHMRVENGPELINRFLEIVTVQKVVSALLTDGVAILLTTVIGMTVMALYHPYLLGYDLVLLALLGGIIFGLGRGGVKSAIGESKVKYAMLGWFEEAARCPDVFRTQSGRDLAMQRTDTLCAEYLTQRHKHFRVLIRQIISILLLQAVAMTLLLGLGGYLVLNEQLTLGQLVAAELIVATIVGSFAKLGKHLEGWYDLMAAVDKLGHILDLPVEPAEGLVGLPAVGPARLNVRPRVRTRFLARAGLIHGGDAHESASELSAPAGGLTVIASESQRSSSLLTDPLQAAGHHPEWSIEVDGVSVDDVQPNVLRSQVTVARSIEILNMSLAENIHLHRETVRDADVEWSLEVVGLKDELATLGLSLSTRLPTHGWPLNESQQRRLMLARALAGRPRLLVVDHLLDALSDDELETLIPDLEAACGRFTLVILTGRQQICRRYPNAFVLRGGAHTTHGHAGVNGHAAEGHH
jgi:putative ABC transport system ATP-binding protein